MPNAVLTGNHMQCSCGREMTERFSVSKKCNLRWEYSFCKSCGRIDADYLYSYDKTQFIERGYSARLNYRDMISSSLFNAKFRIDFFELSIRVF